MSCYNTLTVHRTYLRFLAVFPIRIDLNTDPDPAFWVNTDPAPDSDSDPDLFMTKMKEKISLTILFLFFSPLLLKRH